MAGLKLPEAEWRRWPGLDRLAQVLGEGQARLVGGVVRDTLLGIPVNDIDIATRHDPQQVMALLKAARIKAVPTGIAHGTVTAVIEGGPIEVTTLRRDVSTDGRHAVVAYTDDWREDAARRDFTMNALYADPATGEVFDYFGGIADLEARHVRFIGDPLQRIAEDHLRILRFFRFLARFGDVADPAGLEACTARANDLMALSRERIADELLKLLVARDAVRVVRLMVEREILKPVLPEILAGALDRFETVARREALTGEPPQAIRRLAALLPADAQTAEAVGARLKLSNVQRKRLASATAPADEAPRPLAYRIGRELAIDRLLLAPGSDDAASEALAALAGWTPPALPISGGALVARGLTRGPEVARTLRIIEERWIAEGFPEARRVERLADAAVDQALRSSRSA